MMWKNIRPIIQSEASQKTKCNILMYLYEIQKDDTDESVHRAALRCTHIEQTYGQGVEEDGEGEIHKENSMDAYTLTYVNSQQEFAA